MTTERPLSKPRCADLYCCAGGAAQGLSLAGFDVTGWDLKSGLNYPFERRIGDAMMVDLAGFDFAWASPPCQAHSTLRHRTGKDYDDLIGETRDKLIQWGGPWIIENVVGAPLLNPVMLCGSAFCLRVRRHRIFESNMPLVGTQCFHDRQPEPIDVSGTGGYQHSPRKKKTGGKGRKPKGLFEAQEVMQMSWASRREISQAIPPAFSWFLGNQAINYLRTDHVSQ